MEDLQLMGATTINLCFTRTVFNWKKKQLCITVPYGTLGGINNRNQNYCSIQNGCSFKLFQLRPTFCSIGKKCE
jgi:hypothetical protein